MLKELKFVQGAVAKKDFLPAMTHFAIEGGTVRAYNGTLALSSPIAFNVDCKPRADSLVRAIAHCTEELTTLALLPSGRLKVQSGSFKAFVDCIEGETPHVQPEGDIVKVNGEMLLQALKAVQPFIGTDASRPWSNGVLLRGQSAYATNNVCLVEFWIGELLPFKINLPAAAVKEVVRVNEPPEYLQLANNSITFRYTDGRWIRSQLYDSEWPDLERVLNIQGTPVPVPENLFDGLEVIRPFADKLGRVAFADGCVRTHESNDGAEYALPGFTYEGIYQIDMLLLLKGVATSVDFTTYPKPCVFYGDRLRGAIVGMKPL